MSAVKERIVSTVAKLVGRGGQIPGVASRYKPVMGFPEWLQERLDEYAFEREQALKARISELEQCLEGFRGEVDRYGKSPAADVLYRPKGED